MVCLQPGPRLRQRVWLCTCQRPSRGCDFVLLWYSLCPWPPRRDAVRGLAKAKAPAAELAAACAGAPDEATAKAGSSGRAAEMLAAFAAFRDEVAALAAAGAPVGDVLAACDR